MRKEHRRGKEVSFLLTATMTLGVSVGCAESHVPASVLLADQPAIVTDASAVIGPEGGVLEAGDLTLAVPPGAVAEAVEIRLTVLHDGVPDAFDGYSPVFRFEPLGLTFDEPAQIRLPFRGDEELATIFWTRLGGDEYVARDTRIEDGFAVTSVSHFSRAFVGTACRSECCTQGRGALDVLMNVDNSNSMSEEQASLATQLPRIAEILASGDLDGDGVQDFPAVESLQIGVVSPDMGTGGFSVPTCSEPNFGDDGVLLAESSGLLPGCTASYAGYARYDADAPSADPAAFAAEVACVAVMGTGGCGFEQLLEASLKAVTPSGSPTIFHGGTAGHGDGANAGLVRDGSVLVVLQVTDEDDCSALDPELFNPVSSVYTGDLNLRCSQFPSALHEVDRFADGLMAMRADPADVIFAAIAGIPPGLGGAYPDYRTILRHPLMVEEIDPMMSTQLRPSCHVSGGGLARPPRRIVQTAAALEARGGAGVLTSICNEDFAPAVDAILTRVADRLSGVCTP